MTTDPDSPSALLAAYDAQLRTAAEVAHASSITRLGPLWLATSPRGGFVTYRDLGGIAGDALDELIAAAVRHFAADPTVTSCEWKTRGHDHPADLGRRLLEHGFLAEEIETVMIGRAAALVARVTLPPEVTLRRVDNLSDAVERQILLRRLTAMQTAIFGQRSAGAGEDAAAAELADRIDSAGGHIEVWIAEAAGQVICAGRLEVVPGTDFAGLWGGSTVPQWRGRGVYRAITAARARSAVERGVTYLQSDCTAMSRPILERHGLIAVTTTTPYIWHRPASRQTGAAGVTASGAAGVTASGTAGGTATGTAR